MRARLDSLRILHIDDDVDDADIARRLLAECVAPSYNVIWAANRFDALKAASNDRVDAILLDHHLGAESGFDALRHLRAHGVDAPAILFTGHGDRALDLAAVEGGVVDFVDKSRVDARSLDRAIRYAVERKQVEDERGAQRERELATRTESDATHANTLGMLESINVAFLAVDSDWRVTYVNAAGAELAGGPAAQFLGKVLWTAIPVLLGSEFEEPLRRAMRDQAFTEVYGHYRALNLWGLLHALPWNGGLVIQIHDATARVRAEETERRLSAQLAAERSLFREVLEQLPVAVVVAEYPSGRLLFGNRECERIWRQPFIASPSVKDYDAWKGEHADGRPYAAGDWPLARTFATGEPVVGAEAFIRRGDGTRATIRLNSALVKDHDAQPIAGVVAMEDISRNKAAAAAIRFQAKLLDSVQEAVIATDPEGIITFWNGFAERLYGWSAEEVIGRNIVDVTPVDADAARQIMQSLAAGERWSGEIGLSRKDGSRFHGLVTDSPIFDELGRLSGIIGVSMDISARKRTEQVLLDREAHLAKIVTTQQSIVTHSLQREVLLQVLAERAVALTESDGAAVAEIVDGRVVYCAAHGIDINLLNTCCATPRLAADCVDARSVLRSDAASREDWHDLLLPSVTGAQCVIGAPLLHKGEVLGVLQVFSRESERLGHSAASTVELLSGLAAAALSHAADYDAKLRLEEERTTALVAMQEREAYFRSLIENANDPIITVDAQATITYATPATERVLGFSPAELIGTPGMPFMHPADSDEAARLLQGILESPEKPVVAELRVVNKKGSTRTLRCIGTNLLSEPSVRGIVVNLHDMTEERMLEHQLRQAQKLEGIGQLAGGVAHDFNNMLTVIKTSSDFLAASLGAQDERRTDVRDISDAADRATSLTQQLLAFSRQQVLQPKAVDLSSVVSGIAPMLRRLIGADIEFSIASCHEPAVILADLGQVEQVLMNLVINARDAMPRGGTIAVETRTVELDETHPGTREVVIPGRYAMLSVSDTGSGIDAAVKDRIFEPFFTTKQAGRGTGLGLSTVYGIVKQSSGYISLYSEIGQGTTFKVYFPLIASSDVPASAPAPVALPSGSETILLVDDEEPLRRIANRILSQRGYRILQAANGEEASRVAESFDGHIHAVVTDVVMPKAGGRTLVDSLRSRYPDMAVVYMSGYTNDEVVRRDLLEDDVNFIQKPFTAAVLASAVRHALDRASQSGEPAPRGRPSDG